jgi:hypothetical protein
MPSPSPSETTWSSPTHCDDIAGTLHLFADAPRRRRSSIVDAYTQTMRLRPFMVMQRSGK